MDNITIKGTRKRNFSNINHLRKIVPYYLDRKPKGQKPILDNS